MKKIIFKIYFVIFMLFLSINVTEAASFTISSAKNLSKGTSTKLTIKGSDVTGRFNISTSNSNILSISEDRAWIENDSYTITLNALNVGSATITVTPTGSVSDGSGNKANLSSKSIKITVSLPREKSTDDTLKSLSVEGYKITPEFNKDTLDYSVEVEEGTKNIDIKASANSKYASIKGTGEVEVSDGINNFSVVVKAESGKERIYNLVVNVIDKNPIYVTIDDEKYSVIKLRENYKCPDSFLESELVINNINIPACTNEFIKYNLVGLKKEDGTIHNFIYEDGNYKKYNELNGSTIKIINEKYEGPIEGLTESKIKIDGVEYQVFKFSKKSKYSVIYGVNVQNREKGLYIYDEVNKTFCGYDRELIDYLYNQNKTYLYVIIAFGSGLFLSLICIIMLSKSKKKVKKKLIDKEKVTDNKEKDKGKKNKKEKIKEEIKEKIDDNEIIEDKKDEEKNNIDETQTYYLFDKDKRKKRKGK